MIDINKVTHTKGGNAVFFVRYYPTNSEGMRILADMQYNDGSVETEYFYEDGRYYKIRDSDNDLVGSDLSDDSTKPIPTPRVWSETASNSPSGASTTLVLECLESIYSSIGVLHREIDELGEEDEPTKNKL